MYPASEAAFVGDGPGSTGCRRGTVESADRRRIPRRRWSAPTRGRGISIDEFDVSDEERELRRQEADLTVRLILASGAPDRALTDEDLDRLLGL